MNFTPDQIDERIKKDPEMQKLALEDPTEFEAQHAQVYKEFGYKPDGNPLSLAKKAFGKISKATGVPEELVQGVANVPIPLVTTLGGTALGARLGGPKGAMVGASAGSVAGELINRDLGLRDDLDTTDAAVAAGAPLLGPLASRLKQGLAYGSRFLPGGGAAMHELASDTLEKSLQNIRVTRDHVQVFRNILNTAPDFKVKVPQLTKLLDSEIAVVSKRHELPGTDAYLNKLNEMRASLAGDPAMSFRKLMSWEQGFNELKHGAPHELWARASKEVINDIDAAIANPALSIATRNKAKAGSDAFKNLIKVNRKFNADESLTSLFHSVVKSAPGDTDFKRFNLATFKDSLEKNETLKSAFSPTERKAILDSVLNLGALSKPRSTGTNPMDLIQRSGKGAAVGFAFGGYGGAMAGGAIEELLAKAVQTETGRRIIKHLATTGGGRVNVIELQSMLGQALAGANAGAVAGITSTSQPTPSQEPTQAFANEE